MSEHSQSASRRDAPPHLLQSNVGGTPNIPETETYELAGPAGRSETSAGGHNPASPTLMGPNAGVELTMTGTVTSPAAEPIGSVEARSPTLDSVNSARRNSSGQLPDEQLGRLRAFVSHHALGIQRLRIAEANLINLGGQLNEVREHATSLSGRVDRATSDNARFLLESDTQLSELGRIFDRPRTITANSGIPPGSIPISARLNNDSHSRDSTSDDGLYAVDRLDIDSSASRVPRITPNGTHAAVESLARVALSSSSRASLPTQQPNETADQYDARYEDNIRRVDRAEESWSRAYPGSQYNRTHANPQSASINAPRDVRFECTGPLEETVNQRQHVNIPQAAPATRATYESASHAPGLNPYSGLSAPPIGLSAYRVTQGPVTNGLLNHDHYHYIVLLGKITQLINHKVGTAIEVPQGFKQPKLAEPPKYSGSHSHDEFVDWLSAFLNWLRGYYICGPATDAIRLNYLGLYMEGIASDWYLTEIDNPSRHYTHSLLFADSVCLMHKRFVCTATANDAAIKYNAVRYVSSEGVEGLYYKLDTTAERMIERPNDYEFRRRLFNLLPPWLYEKLKDRNIIPEYCSLDDIRENAKQLEENSLRQYEGIGDTTNRPSSSNRLAKAPRSGEPSRPSRPAPATPAANQQVAASRDRPTRRTPPLGRATRPPRNTSTMQCYSCGKIGHIASEPKCENYDASKARLHAQREADDEGYPDHASHGCDHHGEAAIEDPEVDDTPRSWGGSQYASEYSSDDETHPAAPSDIHTRIASMHVRVAAMRVEHDVLIQRTSDLDPILELFEESSPLGGPMDSDEEMPALESCSKSDDEDENDDPARDANGVMNTVATHSSPGLVDWAPRLPEILQRANGYRTVLDLRDNY
ncbi:hypothetical protein HWV62_36322 [Athelia sp. TMB]|nr:hypothetical protein HWV62_36322 [Athelia sp. TMB]